MTSSSVGAGCARRAAGRHGDGGGRARRRRAGGSSGVAVRVVPARAALGADRAGRHRARGATRRAAGQRRSASRRRRRAPGFRALGNEITWWASDTGLEEQLIWQQPSSAAVPRLGPELSSRWPRALVECARLPATWAPGAFERRLSRVLYKHVLCRCRASSVAYHHPTHRTARAMLSRSEDRPPARAIDPVLTTGTWWVGPLTRIATGDGATTSKRGQKGDTARLDRQ